MSRLGHSIRNLLCFCVVFLPYILLGDLNNGLVAWYPFDGNASDMSGNGNHGTVHGATLATDRHGQANKAYSFGQQEYISTTSQIKGIHNGNQTISGWFYKITGSGWNIFGSSFLFRWTVSFNRCWRWYPINFWKELFWWNKWRWSKYCQCIRPRWLEPCIGCWSRKFI